MKRALALLVALGMIGGALYLRAAMEDDGGNGDDGPTTTVEPGQLITLACITELEDVCQALAATHSDIRIRVEDAGATVDALVEGGSGIAAWLTLVPWTQIANEEADRAVVGDPGAFLAQSRLGFVIWTDRAEALRSPEGACPTIDWRCLGDVASRPWVDVGGDELWGDVEVAHAPPSTAVGQLVLGNAVTGFFGTPTFASNDFDLDDEFRPWLTRLERDAGFRSPLDQLLQQGQSAYAAVGTTEAEIATRVLTSRHSAALEVIYPEPMATAYVALAPVTGAAGADRLREVLAGDDARAELERAGWGPPPALPVPDSGLPNVGVLIALRSLWEDIVG